MAKYRYQVRTRCLNPLIHKPSEWLTVSWHQTIKGAVESLEWHKQHGCDGVFGEARIFELP